VKEWQFTPGKKMGNAVTSLPRLRLISNWSKRRGRFLYNTVGDSLQEL